MPRGGSGKGPQLVYEPIGGGWSKVTGTTDAAYWWHEETCRKQWTEPTQNQIRADDAVRTRKIPRLSQQSGPQHERTITGLAASPDKSSTKSTNSQRPVVPLELPILSPRASLSRRQSDILPDVPVKPRLKVGPVPRQKRRNPTQASPQGDYDQLRIDRLQRQRAAELKTYRTAFRIIDVDGSGAVDPPEVLKVLKMMGKKVDETKFWKVFRDLDLDNSSSLEYNEFAVVMDKLAQNKGPNAGISTKMLSPRAGAAPRAGAGDVSPTGDALPEITSADASLKSVHDAAILSPSGKDFMDDLLEGLRQIVDIQAASFRNRKDAVLAGLMRTEHDARTRSKLGREAILEEDRRSNSDPAQCHDELLTEFEARQLMDKFAMLFT